MQLGLHTFLNSMRLEFLMYFSIGPKERLKDFFNYRAEYERVKNALKRGERIIAIYGLRRVGKTSLMNILFNNLDGINIWIDGRIVENANQLVRMVYSGIKRKGGIFGSIQSIGISIAGLQFSFEKEIDEESIKRIKNVHVFIDEAQYAHSGEVAKALAYLYDRLPNVQTIISGSEVRMLREVLGIKRAEHPLFGRRVELIKMPKLDNKKAKEFLRLGFKQLNVDVEEKELDKVVEKLDGLIGWLTLYGYEKAIANTTDALKKVEGIAAAIVSKEFRKFLEGKKNKQLYIAIIKYAKNRKWKELLSIVRDELGKVNRSSFSRALKELMEYSFIEKHIDGSYFYADPLLRDIAFKGIREFL
ncbi:MAG: hypothetical protein DRO04_00585 [Candidatus Iainarchaeum archaeon]|uniref:ATPase domain-containing protein n=1 Tax=Candidatus Iainarchaeum sp. TaxID=3101447 RepID=A0A497JHW8_9ARCH|nr:MAG: hypothetical protein DRO04_00585 [Candidatus Diapherotrites archaeon]